MIRNHALNSRWWGSPVGVVDDEAFFSLSQSAQQTLLEPYAWAEFYAPFDGAPPPGAIAAAGFIQIDAQIQFRLNLRKVAANSNTDRLSLCFADEENFRIEVEELALFAHERFRHIPGCSVTRANERYALWANRLIAEHPETCMKVLLGDKPQGWFLACPDKSRALNLTLAMLSSTAEISGMLLYQRACVAYSERGHHLGKASFSVTNTPVHNIYAALGARFMPPGGNWLWLSTTTGQLTHD